MQFSNCPRQYYYEKIAKLGEDQSGSLTVLGSIWHYAIDVYETLGGDLDTALATFEYYWKNPWKLGLKIDFWHRGGTQESLLKRGLAMLVRYDELAPWEGDIISTEVPFAVPLGDHTLRGVIDKVVVHPGQKIVEVVDYKTGSYVPEKLKFNVQFTSYCYATERPEFWEGIGRPDDFYMYAGWSRQGKWFHARNTKVYNTGFRGAIDYQRLLLMANEMERSIEAEIFPVDYSGETCGYCTFVETCGTEVEDPRLGILSGKEHTG